MTNVSKIKEEIDDLLKELEDSKIDLAQMQGRLSEVVKQMSQEFGFKTTEKALTKIESARKEMDKLETEIQEDYKKLLKELG